MTLSLFSSVDWGGSPLTSLLSSTLMASVGLSLLVSGSNTSKTIHSTLYSSLCYWVSLSLNSKVTKGSGLVSSALFTALLLLNAAGLPPYLLPISSYPSWVIVLSLVLWLSMVLSSYSVKFISTISHYTPLGSPISLTPLLKSVEVVSKVMRPMTLTLRLTINMTTGHLLLSLFSLSLSSCFMTGWTVLPSLLLVIIAGYYLFELGVALMQSMVFTMLINQYSLEHS